MQGLGIKYKYINILDAIANIFGMTVCTLKVQYVYWFKHSGINQKYQQNVKT